MDKELDDEIKKGIDALVIPENLKWLEILYYYPMYYGEEMFQNHNEDLIRVSRQFSAIISKCSERQLYLAYQYFEKKLNEFGITKDCYQRPGINNLISEIASLINKKTEQDNKKFEKLFSNLNEIFYKKPQAIPSSIIKTLVESYNLSNEEKDELIIYCISKIFQKEEDELRSRGGW